MAYTGNLAHLKTELDSNNYLSSPVLKGNMIYYKNDRSEQESCQSQKIPSEQIEDCLSDINEVDINISNVVTTFDLKTHLNLRYLALNGCNVEYKRESGKLIMKLRKPQATATIWSSGKITCIGSKSEYDAKVASKRIARIIQRLGYQEVKFCSFKVINVLGSCSFPFCIKVIPFSEKYKSMVQYEPELHPGATFRIKELKATMKIFSTGSITVTAPSVVNVKRAIEYVYPLVYPFRRTKSTENQGQITGNAKVQNRNNETKDPSQSNSSVYHHPVGRLLNATQSGKLVQ